MPFVSPGHPPGLAPVPSAGGSRRSLKLAAALAAVLTVGAARPAVARVWTILADGQGDAATIQAAVGLAAPGDTLDLGPGQFNERISIVNKTLLIRGAGQNLTEISGPMYGHLVELRGASNFTEIRDLTIRGGNAVVIGDPYNGNYGGGVYGEGAFFALVRCRVTECTCLGLGAGLYFTSIELIRNEADSDLPAAPPGAAQMARGLSSPGMSPGGAGMARHLAPPSPSAGRDAVLLQDCLIDRNSAGSQGGGFCAEHAYFRIENCVLRDNYTVDGGGGRIFDSLGSLEGCLFWKNTAEFDGGGLFLEQGILSEVPMIRIVRNTFAADIANRAGAGVVIARGVNIELTRNIFAFEGGLAGEVIHCRSTDAEYHGGCNHFWSNAVPSASSCGELATDTTGDPLFCDASGGNFRVCSASMVMAGPCGPRGAFGVGCTGEGCSTAATPTTWSAIKSLFR